MGYNLQTLKNCKDGANSHTRSSRSIVYTHEVPEVLFNVHLQVKNDQTKQNQRKKKKKTGHCSN